MNTSASDIKSRKYRKCESKSIRIYTYCVEDNLGSRVQIPLFTEKDCKSIQEDTFK